jgi:hypothetical protein
VFYVYVSEEDDLKVDEGGAVVRRGCLYEAPDLGVWEG